MSYDDIRFSHWDDPDDDDTEDESLFEYADEYADGEMFYYRDVFADDEECKMCGKERSLNTEGYCSQCWQIWNS